jgi:FKBP-type peptidyl-prolyl cis-trans isomerase FkpA
MRRLLLLAVLLLAATALVVVAQDSDKKEKDEKTVAETPNTKVIAEQSSEGDSAAAEKAQEKKVEWTTNESGLKWADLAEGDGPAAKNGDNVVVHYHLWLADGMEKGKSIQNSRDPQPDGKVYEFPFTVGFKQLIAGWNEGMLGMKPGGLRRLWIPSNLGYGARGAGAMIPPNSDLIFEIELLRYGK